MIIDEKHYGFELLMDYVDGFATSAARERIQAHLLECERCAGVVQGIRRAREEFGEDQERLGEYFRVGEERTGNREAELVGSETRSRPLVLRRRWWGFAGLAAGIALLFLVWPHLRSPDAESLFAEEIADIYRNPELTRSGNGEAIWKEGALAYREQDFLEAASAFEQLFSLDPLDMEAGFYTGICFLYASAPERAIPPLQTVAHSPSNYRKNATWFLGLAHYQAGDQTAAKSILIQIAGEEGHFKQDRAKALFEALP